MTTKLLYPEPDVRAEEDRLYRNEAKRLIKLAAEVQQHCEWFLRHSLDGEEDTLRVWWTRTYVDKMQAITERSYRRWNRAAEIRWAAEKARASRMLAVVIQYRETT